MKVLVTGGTGFLGQYVCRALEARDHEVVGVGRGEYSPYTGVHIHDLTYRNAAHDLVRTIRPEVVVHLAAVVGGIGANVKNPAKFWRDNLYMGLNIIDACAALDYMVVHGGTRNELDRHSRGDYPPVRRLIIAGTTCSYPERPSTFPFCEEDLWFGYPEPTNAPYGIAKRALVAGAMAYRGSFLDARVLMPTNLYGPGDSLNLETNHVIPALILRFLKAKAEQQPSVELWGTGKQTRDFLYVEDAAEAFALAVDSEEDWDLLNLGTGYERSIAELAELIAELTGYDGDVTWNGKLGGQPRRALNCKHAQQHLGWEHTTSLREGLEKTIAWVEEQLPATSRTSA